MGDRIEDLRRCRLLEGFTDVGLQILAAVARDRVFVGGQALQVQGEAPKDPGTLILLTAGSVRCEVKDSENRTLDMGTLVAGDHIGALRLFGEDPPSPITIVADGDVSALTIDRAAFERLRRQKPQTATKLLFAITNDFGRMVSENHRSFGDFAVYAAARASIQDRTFTTYTDLGLENTPMPLRR